MPTEHFERLGALSSAILACNDNIIESGEIADGARGSRYLAVHRHNITFRLYAHPGSPEVTLETVYRPSSIYSASMSEEDFQNYAGTINLTANNPAQLRQEVLNHRVKSLNKEVDIDGCYKPVREAGSMSHPRVIELTLDEYSDEPDGFAVHERLYPGEDEFSTSRYDEKVSKALDVRIDLANELHQSLGLDELSDDPSEHEPDDPGSGMENHAYH